jgi:hypothetical protein
MKLDQCAVTRRAMFGTMLAAGAAMTCAPSLARPLHPLSLDEVIRRNTRARGGAAALDRMHSVSIDVEIDEGPQKLNGHYVATDSGMVRIDLYAAGKFDGAEGVDSNGAWLWGGERVGAKQSVDAGHYALLNGAENHLLGWHRFAKRGHQLALMPSETIDGVTYIVVEVRYETGQLSYFYVDPISWLAVRRRDERAYHPDVNLTKKRVETRFSNFVKVAGITEAHRNEDFDLVSGKLLSTNRVLARRINPVLPADYFDRNRRAPPTWA